MFSPIQEESSHGEEEGGQEDGQEEERQEEDRQEAVVSGREVLSPTVKETLD
jgi:hypothetical protein